MQHMTAGIKLLRQRYHQHPEWFRSDRLCFLDSFFSSLWRDKYNEFKTTADEYGRGRLVPPNAYDLYGGIQPEFCQSNKIWGIDIDDIYASLNLKNTHWVAMWVSIPKRHITIWDSIVTSVKLEVLTEAVEPMCEMIPYVINMLAPMDQKDLYHPLPYTWDKLPAAQVPQNDQSGDCGVYTLKYIELHALGYPIYDKRLCDKSIKQIREKYAVDIYDELQIKGTEKDDYKDLGTYDE